MNPQSLDFAKGGGLLPAIIQHHRSGRVLMLGYMNEEALRRTIETGLVHFYSRSRARLWQKGETSGNVLHLEHLCSDCDNDCLLVAARPQGPTCHLGRASCFPKSAAAEGFLATLAHRIAQRSTADPAHSYSARLLAAGPEAICAKITEEAAEVVQAMTAESDQRLTEEAADLLYHLLVALQSRSIPLSAIAAELRRRQK